MKIQRPQTLEALLPQAPARKLSSSADGSSFGELLGRAAQTVIAPQRQAQQAIEQFANGGSDRLHETLLAVNKAEISLKFALSVRNRLLSAYREVMQMGR